MQCVLRVRLFFIMASTEQDSKLFGSASLCLFYDIFGTVDSSSFQCPNPINNLKCPGKKLTVHLH